MKKNKIVAITLSLLLLFVSQSSVFAQTFEIEDEGPEETEERSMGTALELYQYLQDYRSDIDITYDLNEKATTFLSEHDDLFPCKNFEDIDAELIDETIFAKQIKKSSWKYGDKFMSLNSLYVVDIYEKGEGDEVYFTFINAKDDDSQNYYIYYYGELPDIFDEDYINVIGLPLGDAYFKSRSGDQFETTILAGSYIELADEEES